MNRAILFVFLLSIVTCYFTACETSESSMENIEIDCDDTYFEDGKWTLDKTIEHFEKLGFTNIETEFSSDFFNNEVVYDVEIDTGLLDEKGFNKGETFSADDTVKIYYYSTDFLLTIENCSDLKTILTSNDMEYMTFANKYDGQYVKFDAYVATHSMYDGGTSHIINVAGGDYDEMSKVGSYDYDEYNGLVIRIGDRTWDNNIDETVEEGQNVTVIGKIDSSWCEFFKQLYVECDYLIKR